MNHNRKRTRNEACRDEYSRQITYFYILTFEAFEKKVKHKSGREGEKERAMMSNQLLCRGLVAHKTMPINMFLSAAADELELSLCVSFLVWLLSCDRYQNSS